MKRNRIFVSHFCHSDLFFYKDTFKAGEKEKEKKKEHTLMLMHVHVFTTRHLNAKYRSPIFPHKITMKHWKARGFNGSMVVHFIVYP